MKLLLTDTKGNKIALDVEGMKSYPSDNGEWGWIEYTTSEAKIFWTEETALVWFIHSITCPLKLILLNTL